MNRQVPEKIAIIGNGKVARHMIRYFELVGQPYVQWFRQSKSINSSSITSQSRLARFKHKLRNIFHQNCDTLSAAVADVSKVLLLIPDDQIECFIQNHQTIQGKTLIHFSGSLFSEKAQGCHPLMTFGDDLYELSRYQSIPFVVDEGVDFGQIFPLLENTVYPIKPEQKAIYHAMCVMAGNFSHMLWQVTGAELKNLGLPAHIMSSYLLQNTENFVCHPEHSATGPFVRGDSDTINHHQTALANHPLSGIYQAFYDLNERNKVVPKRSQL